MIDGDTSINQLMYQPTPYMYLAKSCTAYDDTTLNHLVQFTGLVEAQATREVNYLRWSMVVHLWLVEKN